MIISVNLPEGNGVRAKVEERVSFDFALSECLILHMTAYGFIGRLGGKNVNRNQNDLLYVELDVS